MATVELDTLDPPRMKISSFSLKVASRCNLNCTYCYVYNKGDQSWKSRPGIMTDATFHAALNRIRRHCQASGQKSIRIVFHGGEPMLIGPERLARWCSEGRRALDGIAKVAYGIQTNGTLIDRAWTDVLSEYGVHVGISIDGLPSVHDATRIDHQGRGSYGRTLAGIQCLRDAGLSFGILCVIPLGEDPLATHHHLVGLGCRSIAYLMPHFTHDDIGPIRERYGPNPCADFLLPILDDWWHNSTLELRIREFWNVGRLLMGGRSKVDTLGNDPYGFLFVEAGGEIEGLDILRTCAGSLYRIGLTVHDSDFADVLKVSSLHAALLTGKVPIPSGCQQCAECRTCSGGYFPNRYSVAKGFDNPSVWCADLLLLFSRMRQLMGVTYEDTERFRAELEGSGTVDTDVVGQPQEVRSSLGL